HPRVGPVIGFHLLDELDDWLRRAGFGFVKGHEQLPLGVPQLSQPARSADLGEGRKLIPGEEEARNRLCLQLCLLVRRWLAEQAQGDGTVPDIFGWYLPPKQDGKDVRNDAGTAPMTGSAGLLPRLWSSP